MDDIEQQIAAARQRADQALAKHQALSRRAFALRRELTDVDRELRGAEETHRSAVAHLRNLSAQLAGRALGRRRT